MMKRVNCFRFLWCMAIVYVDAIICHSLWHLDQKISEIVWQILCKQSDFILFDGTQLWCVRNFQNKCNHISHTQPYRHYCKQFNIKHFSLKRQRVFVLSQFKSIETVFFEFYSVMTSDSNTIKTKTIPESKSGKQWQQCSSSNSNSNAIRKTTKIKKIKNNEEIQ